MLVMVMMVMAMMVMAGSLRERGGGRERHQYGGDDKFNHKIDLYPVIQWTPRAEKFSTTEASTPLV
jgi:hypothetical protein